MAEPKKLVETALYSLLDGAGSITWTVYNTRATGQTFEYVVFQTAGGDDDGYHLKDRGYIYDYQIVGISTNRGTALDMNAAIDTVMATGALSVAGHGLVRVSRTAMVDYTQITEDGEAIYFAGGIYQIELEES